MILYSVILWSALVRPTTALRFYCEACNTCKIWNWNPRDEGTFVLHHIPKTHGTVELYNLLISSTTSKLFDIFEAPRQHMETTLVVKMSAVRNFELENGATLNTIEFENTYLSSMEFGMSCSVKNLTIKRSKLSHLPPSLHRLKDLNKLTINYSLIQAINLNDIAELPRLSILDLARNRIHSLYWTAESVLSSMVSIIYLGKNRLRSINLELFSGMNALERLDLSQNLISVLSGSLVSSGLYFLDLSYNRLLKLDCCKWIVPNLNNLVANDNLFRSLPRCIEKALLNVSFVDFHNNQLHVDEVLRFGKLVNLEYLTLDNNKLTHVTLNESTIPRNMTYLSLRGNKLKRLEIPYVPNGEIFIDVSSNCIRSVDLGKLSTNLTKLIMDGNPLDCSITASVKIKPNLSCIRNNTTDCD
uniref:Leucine rich immune protein (Coil-less) n=1 Tax=Anopheles culicifacies TaxID=139723 RepID=A0A2C9GUL5_9DIPT